MSRSDQSAPTLLCTSCGNQQPGDIHFCEKCGGPLTMQAFTDPVMGIQTRGFALQNASSRPTSWIVLVGVYLWMVPLLFLGLFSWFGFALGLWESQRTGNSVELWIYGPLLLFFLAMGFVAALVLVKVTVNFRRSRGSKFNPAQDAPTERPDSDTEHCLACGKHFSAKDEECPACGWSYRD